MPNAARPERNWRGYVVQAVFACGGALILAFVFVPFFAPGTDPMTAFFGSFVFMALTVAAAHAVKRP